MREPAAHGERDVLRQLRVRPRRRPDRRLRAMAVHVDGEVEVGARAPHLAQRQIEQRLLPRRLDEHALDELAKRNRAQLGHAGSLPEPPRNVARRRRPPAPRRRRRQASRRPTHLVTSGAR